VEQIFITVNDERIEATGEVLQQIVADRDNAKQKKIADELEAKAKADAKAALLERLGITADEAALLLG